MSGNIKELQINFNPFIERKRILQGMVESELREYLKKIFLDLEKTEDEHNSSDAFSRSKNTRIELKCRKNDFDEFLIEKKKWDKLMETTKEKYLFYICSSCNGVWVFNLRSIPEPKWEVQKHNKTTEFKDNTKIPKLVGFYPKELGKEITNKLL